MYMKKRSYLLIATWISGIVWLLSWIGISLEIFYWHHMTPSLRLNPPTQLPGLPPPKPGSFLLSVIYSSAIAPFVCLFLFMMMWTTKKVSRS